MKKLIAFASVAVIKFAGDKTYKAVSKSIRVTIK